MPIATIRSSTHLRNEIGRLGASHYLTPLLARSVRDSPFFDHGANFLPNETARIPSRLPTSFRALGMCFACEGVPETEQENGFGSCGENSCTHRRQVDCTVLQCVC